MRKIDRLAGILMILKNRGKSTAAQLAATYEVSRRTIYRDIQSLSELGVPVVAEPGVAGGYSLMDGYNFQAVALAANEAEALYLGAGFIASQEGFPLAGAAQGAMDKLGVFLPGDSRRAAEAVQNKISFERSTEQGGEPSARRAALLSQLKSALDQRRVVELEYEPIKDGVVTHRQVESHNLLYDNEAWYLVGRCRLRGASRQFRLSRVRRLKVLDDSFAAPDDPGEPRADRPSSSQASEEAARVRVRRDTPLARHIEESPRYGPLVCDSDDTWIHLSFPSESYSREYLIRILLGFGDSAEILWPDSLRRDFARRLARIAALYPNCHRD